MAGSEPHILLVGGDGHLSGVPRHITDLVRALQGMGRITVVSEPDWGGYRDVTALGARHIALPGLASRLHPRSLRRSWRDLLRLLQDEAPDLVWCHARLPVLMARLALARGAWHPKGAHTAFTYHGLPFGPGHRPLVGALSRRIERGLLARCPPLSLVCLTTAQAETLRHHLGGALQGHDLTVLGNSSHLGDMPPYQSRLPGRHLVMTGRTGWQKNYDRALRLMRHLPDDVYLSLCGAGTDGAAFAARITRLAGPAAARVRALGPLADIRSLLASADGYLLTSRYEGQPIGALEAMEAGLPLYLAGFDGAADLLEGVPASLSLPDDPAAAGRAIDAALTQYLSNRARLSRAIRAQWAAHYAPARFEAAARELVAGWLDRKTSGQW